MDDACLIFLSRIISKFKKIITPSSQLVYLESLLVNGPFGVQNLIISSNIFKKLPEHNPYIVKLVQKAVDIEEYACRLLSVPLDP